MGAPPPYTLNRELADGLRGARLVLELGLDEGRFAVIAEVVGQLAAAGQRPKAIRQSYPALYASYLVFTGVYRYVSGNFWPDVHPGLTGQGYDPGYEFLTASAPSDSSRSTAGRGGARPALGHAHPRPRRDPTIVP